VTPRDQFEAGLAVAVEPRTLRLHIERVTLVGVALTPADTQRFRGALGTELDRLVRHRGLGRNVVPARLPGAIAPTVRTGVPAAQLARDVARSLFAVLRSAQ
jgi:plasmid stabilization system protein ParE